MYQEYSYQNLLKLDHFSPSYDLKNFAVFFMPHSVVVCQQCSHFYEVKIIYYMAVLISPVTGVTYSSICLAVCLPQSANLMSYL